MKYFSTRYAVIISVQGHGWSAIYEDVAGAEGSITIYILDPGSHQESRIDDYVSNNFKSVATKSLLHILCQLISRQVLSLFLWFSWHPQPGIRVSIRCPTQAGISHIVQGAILQPQVPDESPNFRIVPINDGMHAHEVRPATIRPVKMGQVGPVRVCSSCAHKYCLDAWVFVQIVFEDGADGCMRWIGGIFRD